MITRRHISVVLLLIAIAIIIVGPPSPVAISEDCKPAEPTFGLCGLDATVTAANGTPELIAGSHPREVKQSIAVNVEENGLGKTIPTEEAKDVVVSVPPGFVANPTAVPQCTAADFIAGNKYGECADAAAIGIAKVEFAEPGEFRTVPVYNLVPSPGELGKIGFLLEGRAPVAVDLRLATAPPYNGIATSSGISQAVFFYSADVTLWGVPADPIHDDLRGECAVEGDTCPLNITKEPLITLPTACEGPLRTDFEADSWQKPGLWVKAPTQLSHNDSDPPGPLDLGSCDKLSFAAKTDAKPSTDQAESPSGLDFNLDVDDQGLTNPTGTAQSVIKKAVVTLPAGVTVNPSIAEGLVTCSPADLADETPSSEPGQGCPEASKIGSVEAETPLLEDKLLKGSLFIATQDDPATPTPGAENPFDTLIAFYMVIKDPELGILIKLPAKVEPNEEKGPNAGRLVTTLGEPGYEIPQTAHISHFRLHLREGGRSPLITPAHCGTYTTDVVFTPWANPAEPLETTSSFQITRGVGGGSCPPAGTPPFAPGFEAGTLNNAAGSYSPFYLRLTRRDGDQDLTKFSSVLPPGVIGKLAGIAKCPDAAIAAARAKTGKQELASPSCPAASKIGRSMAGAGVGSQLTYVPGSLYLGGPVGGDPLSVISITPAVAGPFDAGTVVVRVALAINPVTAEVEADGSHSDPIPHILKGIVLKVRDLRVHVDRPDFILNPTNCEPSQARATIFGSFANVFDPADDAPVSLTARFQAANCASLASSRASPCASRAAPNEAITRPSAPCSPPAQEMRTSSVSPSPCPARPSSIKATSARSAPGSSTQPRPARRPRSTVRQRS